MNYNAGRDATTQHHQQRLSRMHQAFEVEYATVSGIDKGGPLIKSQQNRRTHRIDYPSTLYEDESPYQASLARQRQKSMKATAVTSSHGAYVRIHIDPTSPGVDYVRAHEQKFEAAKGKVAPDHASKGWNDGFCRQSQSSSENRERQQRYGNLRESERWSHKSSSSVIPATTSFMSPSSSSSMSPPSSSSSVCVSSPSSSSSSSSSIEIIRHPNKKCEYLVFDFLGKGTCGRVLRCWEISLPDRVPKRVVALKVIRDSPAYFQQGLKEIKILKILNETADPYHSKPLVRLYDTFLHKDRHLCLVFEAMSAQLYEILRLRRFKGFPVKQVQWLACQITQAIAASHAYNILHCDLKPENILIINSTEAKSLVHSSDFPRAAAKYKDGTGGDDTHDCKRVNLQVIDFGSARFAESLGYSYIQSRFYRAPETLLGLSYNCAIDMWSLGCVVAELYLGLPILPGRSEFDQMYRTVSLVQMPPDWMIELGKFASKFFIVDQSTILSSSPRSNSPSDDWKLHSSPTTSSESSTTTATVSSPLTNISGSRLIQIGANTELTIITESEQLRRQILKHSIKNKKIDNKPKYRILTYAEKERISNNEEPRGKQCLIINCIEDMLLARAADDHPIPEQCPASRFNNDSSIYKNELNERFLDFIKRCLTLDPRARMTAEEALEHPFLSEVKESAELSFLASVKEASNAQEHASEVMAFWRHAKKRSVMEDGKGDMEIVVHSDKETETAGGAVVENKKSAGESAAPKQAVASAIGMRLRQINAFLGGTTEESPKRSDEDHQSGGSEEQHSEGTLSVSESEIMSGSRKQARLRLRRRREKLISHQKPAIASPGAPLEDTTKIIPSSYGVIDQKKQTAEPDNLSYELRYSDMSSTSGGASSADEGGGGDASRSEEKTSRRFSSRWSTKALVSLAHANRLVSPVTLSSRAHTSVDEAWSPITSPTQSPKFKNFFQFDRTHEPSPDYQK